MSNSVELCPMPLGMPAVRYMAPTPRLFLASLAAFISSTVSPNSAKVWTPALAGVPSSHSWKWRLWLTAKRGKGGRERERSEMLIRWNAYQCRWDTTEPCPDGEIISTTEPVCTSTAAAYFLQLKKRWFPRNCRRDFFGFLADSHGYIFSPCFCWYYRSMGCICGKTGRVFRGSASQTETARQTSKSWSWTSSLTTKPFFLHSIKSLGLSRNSVKNPNAKLFAPQVLNYVLKPTEPPGLGQWLPGAD